jgi:transcriptional/translational regulatory protein YebC/TACO1
MEAALEAGAEDVINDGGIEVLTNPSDFLKVKESMEKSGLKPESSGITLRASVAVTVTGDNAEAVMELLEALENLDDVQTVYSNADFPDEVLKAMVG